MGPAVSSSKTALAVLPLTAWSRSRSRRSGPKLLLDTSSPEEVDLGELGALFLLDAAASLRTLIGLHYLLSICRLLASIPGAGA